MSEKQTDDCCHAVDPRIASHFDQKATAATNDGSFPEMVEVSRGLLYMLCDVAETHPTLLELGCGTGAMSVTLLESGAAKADGIDLSPNSVATAQQRAEAAGVADRATFTVGDGSLVAVEPHDWVVLDRVFCCFPHFEQLLNNSLGAAQQRYAFTMPLDSGWQGVANRFIRIFDKVALRLGADGCPGFTHPIDKIRGRLRAAGFDVLRERRIGLWYAAVFQRVDGAEQAEPA